jgi:hypothetical protein
MARPNRQLIDSLLRTATRLEHGAPYRWASFAHCNCGSLVQTVTGMDPTELQERQYRREGDWAAQARELCPTTRIPTDVVFLRMWELGLDADDFRHLERLDDRRVLARIPPDRRPLRHHERDDAVLYLRAWAELLGEELELASRSRARGADSSPENERRSLAS